SGNTVDDGDKGSVREEPPPLRVDLVRGLPVRVVIETPVPTVRRDLADRVNAVDDVLPERARRLGSWASSAYADEVDIRRPLLRPALRGPALARKRIHSQTLLRTLPMGATFYALCIHY